MRNVFIIAQDCSFRMSDLRCIIGHMDRLAELALKWGTIKASPLPEPEPKKSIRGLELNPCGVGNFILSFSFRRKSGGGKKCNDSPVDVILALDADGNVKPREANNFTTDADIAAKLIWSRVEGKFVRQNRLGAKRTSSLPCEVAASLDKLILYQIHCFKSCKVGKFRK